MYIHGDPPSVFPQAGNLNVDWREVNLYIYIYIHTQVYT